MTHLGILSDTHGNYRRTEEAARLFRRFRVNQVVHCGDIGGPEIVWLLEDWPAHFVFGNVDVYDEAMLRRTIVEAGQQCHERFGSLELEGRRIAFLHGDDSRLFRETTQSGRWDLVCHGHTHVAGCYREGSTVVLNPGALHRTREPSVAVVALPSLAVTPLLLQAAH